MSRSAARGRRSVPHVLANNVQRVYKSFALELDEAAIDGEARMFYAAGHKVNFVDIDIATFAAELRERIPKDLATVPAPDASSVPEQTNGAPTPTVAQQASPQPVFDPAAPTVFICHAHEDAAIAARVSDGLRANSINV